MKNKLASPFREAEFDIIYGEGISKEGDLIDLGVANNVIEKSGSWLSYKGERIGQGRENAKQFLKDNTDIRQTIELEVRRALGLVRAEPVNGPVVAAGGATVSPMPNPAVDRSLRWQPSGDAKNVLVSDIAAGRMAGFTLECRGCLIRLRTVQNRFDLGFGNTKRDIDICAVRVTVRPWRI